MYYKLLQKFPPGTDGKFRKESGTVEEKPREQSDPCRKMIEEYLIDMTLVERTQFLEKMIQASRFLPFNFKFTVGQVNKFLWFLQPVSNTSIMFHSMSDSSLRVSIIPWFFHFVVSDRSWFFSIFVRLVYDFFNI